MDNLPAKKIDLDIFTIVIPILQRISEFLKQSSPSLHMLKFMDLVLKDLKDLPQTPDTHSFFLEMLEHFVPYMPNCLYEEVFSVFDKLLHLSGDALTEAIVKKTTLSMIDKYTAKGKHYKNSISLFLKKILEVKVRPRHDRMVSGNNLDVDEYGSEEQISIQTKSNFFEVLCDLCFFENIEQLSHDSQDEAKVLMENHEMFIEKLQFFIDMVGQLGEFHVPLFAGIMSHHRFKHCLFELLNNGETMIRRKCHEVLEAVSQFYTQFCTTKTVYELAMSSDSQRKNEVEVEFINTERLQISQLVVQCVRHSLESNKQDSYVQFDSLILLDYLF